MNSLNLKNIIIGVINFFVILGITYATFPTLGVPLSLLLAVAACILVTGIFTTYILPLTRKELWEVEDTVHKKTPAAILTSVMLSYAAGVVTGLFTAGHPLSFLFATLAFTVVGAIGEVLLTKKNP